MRKSASSFRYAFLVKLSSGINYRKQSVKSKKIYRQQTSLTGLLRAEHCHFFQLVVVLMFSYWQKYNWNNAMAERKFTTTFCPPAENNYNLSSIFFSAALINSINKNNFIMWGVRRHKKSFQLFAHSLENASTAFADTLIRKCLRKAWTESLTLHWLMQDAKLFLCWIPHIQS